MIAEVEPETEPGVEPEAAPEVEPEVVSEAEPEEVPAEPAPAEPVNPSGMEQLVIEEVFSDSEPVSEEDLNLIPENTSDILAQADELLAMEVPEPVVAPEPIEIHMPEPIVLQPEEPEANEPETPEVEPEVAEEPAPESPVEEAITPIEPVIPAVQDEPEDASVAPPAKKKKGLGCAIAVILALALLLGAAAFGYYYYNNEYLQFVDDLEIVGGVDSVTVTLDTDVDESLLTVLCVDSYGNTIPSSVRNGQAVFTGLNEATVYKISVMIDGFHELRGDITGTYTTPAQTKIIRFEANAGTEYGTVILTFTVEGKDTDNWTIRYATEGEVERVQSFSGHILTVSDLTPGKEYTFTLEGSADLHMVGTNEVTFTVNAPIYAEDLEISDYTGESITAVWNAPEGSQDILWIVRCYGDNGYDETIETTELTATFTGIDPSGAYTIDVTAQGMTSGVMTHVSARSSTITASHVDTSKPLTMTVSWEYEGDAPFGGWLVIYSAEGSNMAETVLVTEPTVTVYPAMPGDDYDFVVMAADGTTVLNNTFHYSAGSVKVFSGYGVTADDMSFRMCRTPNKTDWSYTDLRSSDYTSVFASGEQASFVVYLSSAYNTSSDYIDILFVIRDSDKNVVCTSSTGSSWTYLWDGRYCELDIPTMPTEAGNYSVNVYFNGMAVCRDFFEIQ